MGPCRGRHGPRASAGVGCLEGLPLEDVGLLARVGPQDELVRQRRAHPRLLGFDHLMNLVYGQIRGLERPEPLAHVGKDRPAPAREADWIGHHPDELTRLSRDGAAGALHVQRLGGVSRDDDARRSRDQDDLERDRCGAAFDAARFRRRGVPVRHIRVPALTAQVPREVERLAMVYLRDGRGAVDGAGGSVCAAKRQRTADHRQQENRPSAGPRPHGADSPCSMTDVWSPVACASPCSVCTITASWSAVASESDPGDRMFALTAASIGAAMFRFAARAASIGAARSSARSRSTSRSSSDPPASGSPVVVVTSSALGAMSSLISPWLIAESCDVLAIASPARSCWSIASWSAVPIETASGESTFALTAASIGIAALAFAATAAVIGAARSRSRSRSAFRSRSDVPSSAPSRSVTVSPTAPTVPSTAGSASPTVSTRSPTVLPTVSTVSFTAGSVSPTTPPTVPSVSSTAGSASPTTSPTVPTVSSTAGSASPTTPPTVPSVSSTAGTASPTTPPTVPSVSSTAGSAASVAEATGCVAAVVWAAAVPAAAPTFVAVLSPTVVTASSAAGTPVAGRSGTGALSAAGGSGTAGAVAELPLASAAAACSAGPPGCAAACCAATADRCSSP